MRLRTLLLPGATAVLAAGLFVACGDGPDPDPTPTTAATTAATQPSSNATSASSSGTTTTAGGSPVAKPGAKIGKKASDLTNLTTTASGLKYVDNVVGTGAQPSASSKVTVHYTGTNAATGEQFDSSVDRGQPIEFAMNGVINGFSEGLSTMKVGGKRTVLIPAALGYGPYQEGRAQTGDIIFDIELIAVK